MALQTDALVIVKIVKTDCNLNQLQDRGKLGI